MKNEDGDAFRKPGPPLTYDVNALMRAPTGHDDAEVALAKRLARASATLWAEASPAIRDWFRGYCQTNCDRMAGLLELVMGLNQLERRHRRGGRLPPVDWLAELRAVAFEKRWSEPRKLIAKIAARFAFDDE